MINRLLTLRQFIVIALILSFIHVFSWLGYILVKSDTVVWQGTCPAFNEEQ